MGEETEDETLLTNSNEGAAEADDCADGEAGLNRGCRDGEDGDGEDGE